MKRASKKAAHYQKFFRFFLFAQISTLVIAVAINVVILVPNNFKKQHRAYEACLERHVGAPNAELQAACKKPYEK